MLERGKFVTTTQLFYRGSGFLAAQPGSSYDEVLDQATPRRRDVSSMKSQAAHPGIGQFRPRDVRLEPYDCPGEPNKLQKMRENPPPVPNDRLPPAVFIYETSGLWSLALRAFWLEFYAERSDSPVFAWIRYGKISATRALAAARPGSFVVIESRSGRERRIGEEIAFVRHWCPYTQIAVVSENAKTWEAFYREIGAVAVVDRVVRIRSLAAMIHSHFRSLPQHLLDPWPAAWDIIPWREFATTNLPGGCLAENNENV